MVFLFSRWQSLPLHVRVLIAKEFGVAKVGPTHVFDNRILSDGYRTEEVEAALNPDALRKFVGSDSDDLMELWDLMVAKVTGEPAPEVNGVVVTLNDATEDVETKAGIEPIEPVAVKAPKAEKKPTKKKK